MNVLFEEDGGFKTGTLLAANDTSLQEVSGFGKPAKLIVIGQGQQFDTVVVGTPNHVGRGHQAIGYRGMAMQVGVQWLHAEKNSSISRAITAG